MRPEEYIKHAFRCTSALGALAKSLSPGAARELLAGTFTPRSKTTTPYVIPRSTTTRPCNQEAASAWSGSNFPPVLQKPTFNIGCEERPKVGIVLNDNEGVYNNITLTQGRKMESPASTFNANHSTTSKVTNPTESSLQTMSQTNEAG